MKFYNELQDGAKKAFENIITVIALKNIHNDSYQNGEIGENPIELIEILKESFLVHDLEIKDMENISKILNPTFRSLWDEVIEPLLEEERNAWLALKEAINDDTISDSEEVNSRPLEEADNINEILDYMQVPPPISPLPDDDSKLVGTESYKAENLTGLI